MNLTLTPQENHIMLQFFKIIEYESDPVSNSPVFKSNYLDNYFLFIMLIEVDLIDYQDPDKEWHRILSTWNFKILKSLKRKGLIKIVHYITDDYEVGDDSDDDEEPYNVYELYIRITNKGLRYLEKLVEKNLSDEDIEKQLKENIVNRKQNHKNHEFALAEVKSILQVKPTK